MRHRGFSATSALFDQIFPLSESERSISPIMYPSGRVWTRLRMSSPVVDLLADLAAALDGGEVPWYLFGAQAAILHGVNRLTG